MIKYWSINLNQTVISRFPPPHFDFDSSLVRLSTVQPLSNPSFRIQSVQIATLRSSLLRWQINVRVSESHILIHRTTACPTSAACDQTHNPSMFLTHRFYVKEFQRVRLDNHNNNERWHREERDECCELTLSEIDFRCSLKFRAVEFHHEQRQMKHSVPHCRKRTADCVFIYSSLPWGSRLSLCSSD